MKIQRIFPGIILIGFGAWFLFKETGLTMFQAMYTWPTLLMIVGIAFLGQGYVERDNEAILPGVIMTGFGLHFHLTGHLSIWPTNHVGMLVMLISIGFFLRFQRTGKGLFQAFLFLMLTFMLLFSEKIGEKLDLFQSGLSFIWKFWPALIIVVGVYFLIKRKK